MYVLTPSWKRSWWTMQAESEKNKSQVQFFPSKSHHIFIVRKQQDPRVKVKVWHIFTVFCISASEGSLLLSDCEWGEILWMTQWSLLFITFLVSFKRKNKFSLLSVFLLNVNMFCIFFLNPLSSSRSKKKKVFCGFKQHSAAEHSFLTMDHRKSLQGWTVKMRWGLKQTLNQSSKTLEKIFHIIYYELNNFAGEFLT